MQMGHVSFIRGRIFRMCGGADSLDRHIRIFTGEEKKMRNKSVALPLVNSFNRSTGTLLIFIILTCSGSSAFADIREDIEAAKKDVVKAEQLLQQRKSALSAARDALKPFNERMYQLEKEKNELLEKLYAGDFTAEKKRQYEQAIERYFAAAKAAQPAEIAAVDAVSLYKSAQEQLDKFRQRLAELREKAAKGLEKEAPPYLMKVEAKSGGMIFYSATWVEEERELDKKIKIIKEQIEAFKKRIRELSEDAETAMDSFEDAHRVLQSVTNEVIGALWNTFWYDVFADASVLAVKIMLDYREMGPWAFPYQAIEQTVAVFSDDGPSGPDLSVIYGQRSLVEDSVIFSRQFVSNRGGDIIQKFIAEGVEAMLGGHAVMIEDGDLHAALETHVLGWDKAETPKTGFYSKIKDKLFRDEIKVHVTKRPKLKDIRFKDIQDAARRKVASADWWQSRVGSDLLKDAALEVSRKMLPDATSYFEKDPAVGEYMATQAAYELSYRWLKFSQDRRNIAAAGLEALQKKLDKALDELEKKRHKRKLQKTVDEESGENVMTLELVFSSEMDNVAVKIGGRIVDGGIEGRIWTGEYEIAGDVQGELFVSGVEKTSRKELDADPSTVPRLVTEGAHIEFEDWEKGPDRTHTLLFKPRVVFVKRAQFEMGGKIYYDAGWEPGPGAAERSLLRRIDKAIDKNDIRDAMIRIWLNEQAEGMDFIFSVHDIGLKPDYSSKSFSGKINADIIKKEASLSEIPLLIRVMTGKGIPFDPDPKTIAQTDPKVPGGWLGLESDKTSDSSHRIKVGEEERPVTGKFLLDSVFTKADFEEVLAEFYPAVSDGGEAPSYTFYVGGGDDTNRYKGIEVGCKILPKKKGVGNHGEPLWEEGRVSICEELQGRKVANATEAQEVLSRYLHHLTGYRLRPVEIGRLDTSGMYSLTTTVECFNSTIRSVEGSVFCFHRQGIGIQMYFYVLPSDVRVRMNALTERAGHSTKVEGYPFFDEVYIVTGAAHVVGTSGSSGKDVCGFKDNFLFIVSVNAPEHLEDAITRKIVDRFTGKIKNIVFFDQSRFPAPVNPFPAQASYGSGILFVGMPWLIQYSADPSSSMHRYSSKFELEFLDEERRAERLIRNLPKLSPEKRKELIDEIRRLPPEERKKLPPELRRLVEENTK